MAYHQHTPSQRKKMLSKSKAKKMLHEGVAKGKKLTKKQRGFFALVASGKKPTRLK